jgi:endonuclease III related protein
MQMPLSMARASPPSQSNPSRIGSVIARISNEYGPQGWWPVQCERRFFTNPQGTLEQDGYHPGQFDFPRSRRGRWEICCGAVLTQNTAWLNVRKALGGLRQAGLFTPERLLAARIEVIRGVIRPAGYFNQKSVYLRAVAEWFVDSDRALVRAEPSRASLEAVRPELLKVRGVGPETADSILLYAYALPTFVVDAYTRRIFSQLAFIDANWKYERIRALFEASLEQGSAVANVEHWQQAHALIVEHAKRTAGRNSVPK